MNPVALKHWTGDLESNISAVVDREWTEKKVKGKVFSKQVSIQNDTRAGRKSPGIWGGMSNAASLVQMLSVLEKKKKRLE